MKKISILTLLLFFLQISIIHSFEDLSQSDRMFLENIAKKTFHYFWNEANPENGLIPDATTNRNCSISVVGFGLAAICIADARGWITRQQAYDRVLKTLRCFVRFPGNPSRTQVESEYGHHYHWVDIHTGKWIKEEGIFASDTAAFIAGVLTVGEYFKGTEVETLADKIYENVDWTWFLNRKDNTVYVGWTPGSGHGGAYSMNEIGTFIILMAVGSPTYPIPVECWYNLGNQYYHAKYGDFNYVGDGAAYTHQWPFCFIDPRFKKDYFLDYDQNVREFSLASRQWCIDHKDEGYSDVIWGLNVGAGPGKYGEYAAPVIPGAALPYNGRDNDGTVAPNAAVGNIPFTPKESLETAKTMVRMYGDKIFGKYGFTDTFNVKKNFWSKEYLGIDQGPIVIGIDNFLYGTVWKSFTNNKHVKKAMEQVGFVGIIDNFDESRHSQSYAEWYSVKGGVVFFRDYSKCKEGRNSLKVAFDSKIDDLSFYAEPLLRDFSNYKYLSFWKTGGAQVNVFLEDSKKNKAELKLASAAQDHDWELFYYAFPDSKFDLKSVRRVIFKPSHASADSRQPVLLDFIHLTNRHLFKAPPAPVGFTAKTGQNGGEIDLSWKIQSPKLEGSDLIAWKIKVSETPIRDKNDYVRAKDAIAETFPFDVYKIEKFTLSNLVPGKKYYIASTVENSAFNTSEIVVAEAVSNSKKEDYLVLDRDELVDFDVNQWYEFASPNDKIKLGKEKGMTGDAMQIVYDTAKSDVDYHWMGIGKKISGKLPPKCAFSFVLKGGAPNMDLEFKLTDKNGAVFGKKVENIASKNRWTPVKINSSDLTYWWGGTGSKMMGLIQSVEIVFTTKERVKGSVAVNQLTLVRD